MERRSFVGGAGLVGVAAVGAGMLAACGKKEEQAPAAAASAPAVVDNQQIRWRLASSFPKSLDTIFGAAEVFSKAVSDMSGGKFQISVHAGGELMPPFGVVDGVQGGTVEMAHTAPYYFFGKDPTFALDCAIPFGLNSRQMSAWMYEGNGLKLTREFYAGFNIVNFPMGNTGAQMGGWFRKEIKSLADIKGLKMRIGGFGGAVLSRIGAVPQNIPGGEIYQALEKGTIDAAEWVGPYDDHKLGFNKVAPNYYYPGWWEGGPQLTLYVNSKAYESLSPEYKAIVQSAASHAHVNMQARYDARNPAALKALVGEGTKLFRFPKDVMDGAFKEAMALYGELSGSNPAWKKIYEDYAAFRRDANLWFRFTEAGFDNFMQAQKL
ncbi:MAG: TRAP transporter substrate-binding protein [Rhizobacter sp.]|nr:TRAP transporter substrate-binding protein [Rhizobacter sp.]